VAVISGLRAPIKFGLKSTHLKETIPLTKLAASKPWSNSYPRTRNTSQMLPSKKEKMFGMSLYAY
jgi:hypothetical protein